MKDFYISHFEECDYCNEIYDREDLSDAEKDRLIDDHTTLALGNRVDKIHDQQKDA